MDNPLFIYATKPNKHPSTLAGIMTSTSKKSKDYKFLATSLSDFGIKTLIYGTDGEKISY